MISSQREMRQIEFGEQIKALRKKQNMTQEQFADKLNVTRQAVSNWENNRNLPDIEMLIRISTEFHISLDQLILGGNDMNMMTKKLINDGSETRRAKFNLLSEAIGAGLMIIGFLCFVIKALSVEYVDETGLLHENFFLIPIGCLFLLSGAIVVITATVIMIIRKQREKGKDQ
jgi:transcriptional regulator with XRE-family HTH domain